MRRLLCTVALVFVVASGLRGEPAAAQPPEPAPVGSPDESLQRERARAAYTRGEAHFAAAEYLEAEAAFWEAYGAIPNPVVLLGIAEVRERAGNVVGAIEVLQRYLDEQPEAADRDMVAERITELRARPAQVSVTSEPPGAEILVDNEPTGAYTPSELTLAAGAHTITVRAQGWIATTETVEAEIGGRAAVKLTLEPEPVPDPVEEPFGSGEPIVVTAPTSSADEGSPSQRPSTAVWVATGIAATALVTGTVFGFMALAEQSDFDLTPSAAAADRGERLALFADISFGVAAAAGVTALVLHLTRETKRETRPVARRERTPKNLSVAPAVNRAGAGVAARWEF